MIKGVTTTLGVSLHNNFYSPTNGECPVSSLGFKNNRRRQPDHASPTGFRDEHIWMGIFRRAPPIVICPIGEEHASGAAFLEGSAFDRDVRRHVDESSNYALGAPWAQSSFRKEFALAKVPDNTPSMNKGGLRKELSRSATGIVDGHTIAPRHRNQTES
jgi:hypothetical protein